VLLLEYILNGFQQQRAFSGELFAASRLGRRRSKLDRGIWMEVEPVLDVRPDVCETRWIGGCAGGSDTLQGLQVLQPLEWPFHLGS
jgi:hypothetical protein